MDYLKQRFYQRVAIAIVLYLCTLIYGDNCKNKITRPALAGFRCTTEADTNITLIEAHRCTYLCITRKDCSIVNYNVRENVCILSNGPCIVLEADEEFQLNYLGLTDRSECFRWLPSSAFDNSEMVSSLNCHPREAMCHVGRLVSSSNVLPGKYLRDVLKVWTVFNGVNVNSVDSESNQEILDVSAGCQVTWMPFRAGDAVPVVAVKGGFLASNGAILFVIKGSAETYTGIFGYYDPESAIGLLAHSGVVEVTDMELLVLL